MQVAGGGVYRIVGLQQAGQLRNPEVVRYANRLSDLLFMLARAEEGSAIKPPLPQPERFVDLQYLRAAGVQ